MQGTDPRAGSGKLSPDGLWRWEGERWVPTTASTDLPMPPAPSSSTTVGHSWAAIGGGVAVIVAAVAVIVGCALPYVYYSDSSGGPSDSSVFNVGFSGGLWYAAEPVVVVFLAVTAAIGLMVWANRTVRAVCAGALLAFGIQTFTLFIGYAGSAPSLGRIGPGGIIGAVGGLILLAGGVAAAISLFTHEAPKS